MDGFVRSLRQIGNGCSKPENRDYYPCRKAKNGPAGQPDVMGFHTAREIPNYWKYAKRYTLQDRMFAPSDSWTLPAHLFLVSGWSATCTDLDNWRSCHSDQKFPGGIWADGDAKMWTPPMGAPRPYIWAPHHVDARQGRGRLGLLRGSRHVHRAAVRRAPWSG